MKKITYRPVYNRNKRLKANNTALLQVEAYLEGRKIYFSSHIYLTPDQWDNKRHLIKEQVVIRFLLVLSLTFDAFMNSLANTIKDMGA